MAIQKNLSTEFGVDAVYHNIGTLQTNWPEQSIVAVVHSFANEEARRNGARPLKVTSVQLVISDNADPDRGAVYAALKTLPEWQGVQDV